LSRMPWLSELRFWPPPPGWGFVQQEALTHKEFVTIFHQRLRNEQRETVVRRHIEKLIADYSSRAPDRSRLTNIIRRLDEEYVHEAAARVEAPSPLRRAAAVTSQPESGDVFHFAPLLNRFSSDEGLLELRPFAEKRVVLVLHFLRDLLPFVAAAERLGLEPARTVLFHKTRYGYPHREPVKQWLSDRGYEVRGDDDIPNFYAELERSHPRDQQLLIIEDGGYFAPRIATSKTNLPKTVTGIVEQTSNGIRLLEEAIGANARPPFPFLSLPACQIKNQIEPPFIGRATAQTLQGMMTGISLAGQEIGLIGFGTIGAQVAHALRNAGAARIKVYDKQPEKLVLARAQGYEHVDSAESAARGSFLVLGGTGQPTIQESVINELRDGAIVGSTSSRTVEIDMTALERLSVSNVPAMRLGDPILGTRYRLKDGREIVLLANGTPLNFWNTEGMPDQLGDFIMSLLFLAAAELGAGRYKEKHYDIKGIDGIAEDYRVAKWFLEYWYQ